MSPRAEHPIDTGWQHTRSRMLGMRRAKGPSRHTMSPCRRQILAFVSLALLLATPTISQDDRREADTSQPDPTQSVVGSTAMQLI